MQDARPNPTLDLDYCVERPIFMDFLQHAGRTPDAVAVVSHDATCSYGELEAISQRLASFLLGQGAKASDRVVIVSGRCAGLVYAMLGASRAGLTFTVADMAYPRSRIEQIIQVLEPSFVLVCGEAAFEVDPLRSSAVRVVNIPEMPGDALKAFAVEPRGLPDVNPAHPAYITFTSGSTGEPKGIVTHHSPLVHFIEWHSQRHSLTRESCFSLLSGLGHDPVYRDVFTPLSIGAKVVIPAQSTVVDPAALAKWIHQHGISVIHLTPPLGKLIETGAKISGLQFGELRYLFWGGDALSNTLYQQICLIAPNAISVNFYGTTETPQAMAFHQVDPALDNSRIPLGIGIEGAQLLLVNEANQLVGEGETGEILIRSPYLSLGYYGDAALTTEKFVVNPFTRAEGDICYRTGDLGTYLADGSVMFRGRGDSQVKIRGHRIELAEIEGSITRHPRIKQCVVLADSDRSNVKLVACCVSTQPVSSVELREHVGQQLPDYMVPALFVFVDSIALTPNGKIDKRALQALVDNQAAPANSSQDLSPLALKLTQAWAQILEVPRIDPQLTFVELGGDSLSFVQASMVLEELIGHLPDQWEMIPVVELCELASDTKASRFSIRAMEVPVFMRVVSIVLIVIGHFHLFSHWPVFGETMTLFLISGVSLARFQFKAINEYGSVRTLVKSVASIAVPTILYTALVQMLFDKVHWQSLLLISNWFTADTVGNFAYWYIELLVQMLVIIGFVLSFERVRNIISADPFRCFVIASCVLAVADVLISALVFDASALLNRVPQHYLAIMVLGMAIHSAGTTRQKLIVSVVTVLVVGWQDMMAMLGYGPFAAEIWSHVDIAVPAALLVIWVRSIPVPGIMARGMALIASSTLYIYLTHFQFQSVARRLGDYPVLAVVLAIVGGVAVGYAWNKVVRWVLMRGNGEGKKRRADKVERVA
ncbi:amino acid adenylation domain-containing protein [Pseudomonas umsongensis]|uniref:amino acid adenylation domain-containing protein n=1 Tax=Pseudomonas umsongensis TaxID=198618 RepID=UPI00200B0788|nr:amino acid adenylation domain-containing protein [Pseudomonas umsongensis]MCK8657003.1 amino acid adenylation domain-containing protein [Pseudomonas umsongensis]